jgi:CubicO group peptidase (beta-lactamase class C family)
LGPWRNVSKVAFAFGVAKLTKKSFCQQKNFFEEICFHETFRWFFSLKNMVLVKFAGIFSRMFKEPYKNIVLKIRRYLQRLINDPLAMIRGLVVLSLIFAFSVFSYRSVFVQASGPNEYPEEASEAKAYFFSEEDIQYFDDEITNLLLRSRFNGHIFVARHGTILYDRSFGFSDFRNSTPVSQETPFQLASITKTFTATAVLMLHQDEKLHIDSLVVNYIPEFPYPNITVRHLLNHTSGLQNYMWVMERFWTNSRMPNNEEMLQTFIKQRRPLDFSPGTRWAYSNTGYAILGLLVERVSGQPFSDFMREQIFDPLKMHNTFVYDVHNETKPETRAYGFRPNRGRFVHVPDVSHDGVMGDKGIFSTTADLYKWDQAIYRHELLSPDLWELAFEKAQLRNDSTVNYGMGWRLQTFLDHRIVHHPGRWNGFRTSFKRFIDDGATLIILANNNMDIASLIDNMQKIIFHKELLMIPDPEQFLEGDNGTVNGELGNGAN